MMTLNAIHPMMYGMNALFSRIILRTCFVRESSGSSTMDRFLKIGTQKIPERPPQALVDAGTLCFWGPPGIGKTHMAEKTVGIWLGEDTLRSKQATLEFLERVRSADRAVIIDNFEALSDLVGLRELKGPPSRGQLFITARDPVKLAFPVLNIEFPVPGPEKIFKIVCELRPSAPHAVIRELAARANGSVRYVLQGLDFKSDAPDNFTEPKKDLEVLLVRGVTGIPPAMDRLHEHGYSWGVVQENYADASHMTLDDMATVADMMSRADVIDENIYKTGTWDLAPYFAVQAVFAPALIIKKTLKKLRPGSMWTKYQNFCMKKKKLESIYEKIGARGIERFPLILVRPEEWPRLTSQDLAFMKKICAMK